MRNIFLLFSFVNIYIICASQELGNVTSVEDGQNETEGSRNKRSQRRTKRSNFESFLFAHTLNPSDPRNSYYEHWTVNDWDYWTKNREPLHDRANNYQGTPLTLKSCNAVILATPSQVERAFEGPLYAYDHYNSIYWSNKRFRTYILQRDRRNNLNVYECGYLFFASRLVRGQPVNFYAAFPHEFDYQTDGDLTEDLGRHCRKLPHSKGFYNSGSNYNNYNSGSTYNKYNNHNNNYNSYGYGYGQTYYYSPESSYRYYVGDGYASNHGWGSGTARQVNSHFYTYDK